MAYSTGLIPERWRPLYQLNPMVGVVDGFRWMIGSGVHLSGGGFAISLIALGLVLITGLYFFRRMEHSFADVV